MDTIGEIVYFLTNTKHLYNFGRWPDVLQMLCKCFMHAVYLSVNKIFKSAMQSKVDRVGPALVS